MKDGLNPVSNLLLNLMVSRQRRISLQDSYGKHGKIFKNKAASISLLLSLSGFSLSDFVSLLDITLRRFGEDILQKK